MREVEEEQVGAVVNDRLADVHEVFAQRHLTTGQVDPEEVARFPEEGLDLLKAHLVPRLHFPDVAGLALVVAPEGGCICELVREIEATEVGLQDAGAQVCVG